MITIDGKKISEGILQELKSEIAGRELGLAAVVIGNDPSLQKFVELKKKAAHRIGVQFSSYYMESNLSEEKITESLKWLSRDPQTHGILIELPVPKKFSQQRLLDAVDPKKDVDVLTSESEQAFYENRSVVLPPAVLALQILLEKQGIQISGKKIAVFGQGRLIGKPISHWLEKQGANVLSIDEYTKKPEEMSIQADIIISGVGKPGLITADMVREGAMVIDYGYGKKGNEMVGDVDFEAVSKKASQITPVPGGMGPIVVAAVLKNLVALNP